MLPVGHVTKCALIALLPTIVFSTSQRSDYTRGAYSFCSVFIPLVFFGITINSHILDVKLYRVCLEYFGIVSYHSAYAHAPAGSVTNGRKHHVLLRGFEYPIHPSNFFRRVRVQCSGSEGGGDLDDKFYFTFSFMTPPPPCLLRAGRTPFCKVFKSNERSIYCYDMILIMSARLCS